MSNYSFLGRKRAITNRLKKLVTTKTQVDRKKLAAEAQIDLNELYDQLKKNSAMPLEIDRVLRSK